MTWSKSRLRADPRRGQSGSAPKSGILFRALVPAVQSSRAPRRYPNKCSELLSEPVASVAPRYVKRALDYIPSYPQQRSSPEFLAELGNVILRSLQYSFKAVTCRTIAKYQYLLRLEKPRLEITARSVLPLVVVVQDRGFSSLSNFGHHFKKVYGITPSSFRRGEA